MLQQINGTWLWEGNPLTVVSDVVKAYDLDAQEEAYLSVMAPILTQQARWDWVYLMGKITKPSSVVWNLPLHVRDKLRNLAMGILEDRRQYPTDVEDCSFPSRLAFFRWLKAASAKPIDRVAKRVAQPKQETPDEQ